MTSYVSNIYDHQCTDQHVVNVQIDIKSVHHLQNEI